MPEQPGRMTILSTLTKMISGDLAKQWKEGTLPDGIHIQTTDKFTLETDGVSYNMFFDGINTMPFQASNKVDFQIIPKSVPVYSADEPLPSEDDWDVQVVCLLPGCKSLEETWVRMASPSKYREWTDIEFAVKSKIVLPEDVQEPLAAGCEYSASIGPLTVPVKVMESKCDTTLAVFEVSASSLSGMVANRFRTTVWKASDGKFYARTQEKFDSGRFLANSDEHIRGEHLKLLHGLKAVCTSESI